MRPFTLYWLDGKREVVYGRDCADAMNRAGYGYGALRALDVWVDGNDKDFSWDAESRKWVNTSTPEFAP